MILAVPRWVLISAFAGVLAASGCHGPGRAELTGVATDEWTRQYTLTPGGMVDISNRNGPVEVQGGDGTTVDIVAERTARALTSEGARELLPRIRIEEEVSPDLISVQTEGIDGMLIGAAYEVRFRVTVPRDSRVRLRVANGNLSISDINGSAVLNSTNGTLSAERLGGGLVARSVNGKVSVGLAAVGADPLDIRSTNGGIDLALPAGASATLMATVENGSIDVTAVPLETIGDQTRRRVRGRLNGGGTPVELSTVNGSVRVTILP